ncbi:MAG: hypothetical protein DCC58_11180 [Chloroflexi bacterium]|nr:MAG: hypothetical protein DCC58_11180 [Chloroflexota bacterium]
MSAQEPEERMCSVNAPAETCGAGQRRRLLRSIRIVRVAVLAGSIVLTAGFSVLAAHHTADANGAAVERSVSSNEGYTDE